jgi:hypothetical protein
MPNSIPLTSLADLADGVTVVPFHPKHAQWVKDRVKLLAMVTHQHLLLVVAGNLTGMCYRDEIVQPYVIPFIQAEANNVTFQQDNARPHVARVVRDDLTQHNVDLLPWPAVSPDLPPIEHVWHEMKVSSVCVHHFH